MMKIKILGGLCTCMLTSLLSAQQTFQTYNLLDEGGTLSADNVEKVGLLNDKNDSTVYSVPFEEQTRFMYQATRPLIVTGNVLIASDKQGSCPKTFKLEASNDGVTWKRILSELGVSLQPREVFLSKVNSVDAYTYFRFTVTGIAAGQTLEIAEWQLLGYPYPAFDDLTEKTAACTGQYPENPSLAHLMSDKVSDVFTQSNVQSCWVEYELDTPQKIKGYALMPASIGNTTGTPASWSLLGSNDRTNWDVVDSRSNVNLLNASGNLQVYILGKDRRQYDWAKASDLSQRSMMDIFWESYGSGHYLIHGWHPNTTLSNDGFNYWWMAHVIDVFVDAYQRTGDKSYRKNALEVYNAMLSYGKKTYGNNNSLWNGFFDDMEWMGLACLRADAVWGTKLEKRWIDGAVQLWDWTKAGWNENYGGGIQWNDKSPFSKNACSNAPAAILAARLYQKTGKEEYLDWAKKIWEWMNTHLLFENGIVKDSYLQDDWGWTFTYNQGTWMGACMELYQITNEQKYYDAAMKTADYVVNDWGKFSPHGVLDDGEGKGDGGLFKGILMRYLSQWILSGKLDAVRERYFIQYMLENGKSLWDTATLKPEIIFKNNWRERPERVPMSSTDAGKRYDASVHLSGVMLFELLDELNRTGKLPVENQNPESMVNKENAYKYYRLELKSNRGGKDIELARWQLFANNPSTGIEEVISTAVNCCLFTEKGRVVIENKKETPLFVKVYAINGCLVESLKTKADREAISLSAGVYLIEIYDGQSSFREKVCVI